MTSDSGRLPPDITRSWQPYVKHYAPNMSYDYGGRVAALWPER
jgi:hypothetical protein